MRKLLSLLFGKRTRARRSRLLRPLCEPLEPRLPLAVASLYVTTRDADPQYIGSTATFKEFTTAGALVRSVPIVYPSHPGEPAHDLIVTPGHVHVYTGNEDVTLYDYNGSAPPGMSPWSGIGQGGISTRGDIVSSGGAAVIGNNMFITDMSTPLGPENGIVWISLDRAVARFAEDTEPIDVAAGLDGRLYSLDAAGTVRVYNPNPYTSYPQFQLLQTIQLPAQVAVGGSSVTMDYRAIAVDQNGLIYAADWNAHVTRFDASGAVQLSKRLPTFADVRQGPWVDNLVDLDFLSAPGPNDGGQLVVGTTNGVVARVSANFLTAGPMFNAGTGPVFVAVGPALVEVSASAPGSITEGDAGTTAVDFTLSLSNPSTEAVSVSWTTSSGSATGNVDFDASSGTINFAPGETVRTLTLQVMGDTVDEFDESFSLRLTTAAGAVVPSQFTWVSILDDDAPATPVPASATSAGNATDFQGDAVFDSFSSTTGTLRPDHNTATRESRTILEFNTAGIDLAASPVVTLDLYVEAPWYQSTTAKIYGYAGDGTAALADATRTSTLLGTLTGLTTATAWRRVTLDRNAIESLMGQSSYIGIVIVADTPTFFEIRGTADAKAPKINFWSSTPPVVPTFDIFASNVAEGNPNGPVKFMTFTIRLSQATTAPVTVDYAPYLQPNVIPGVDYVATSGTLTFDPGETLKTVTVQLIGDTAYEQNEYLYLRLTNPNIASFHTLMAGGQIINDDAQPTATLSAATTSVVEPGAGYHATVSLTVSLSSASYQSVTVNYATADETAAAGVGGNYNDYVAASGTLTFAPGETSKTIEILVAGESFDEPDETFKVNLTGAQNASVGSPGTTTVTIVDSDPTPVISMGGTSVDEHGGPLRFIVTLSNASFQPITVNYTTVDGTGRAGVDYVAKSGTLTFPPGYTGLAVEVALLDDDLYEGAGESIQLRLSSPTNATIGNGYEITFGTVKDNDPKPVPVIGSPIVSEDGGSATFTVALSGPGGFATNLSYSTAGGTATEGVDYTAASGTLAFAPGETSKTVTVAILQDNTDELDETFELRIPFEGITRRGTGTIIDDDAAPTLSVNSSAVAEGNSAGTPLTFTFSLSNPSSQPIVVNYATADGSAIAGTDYTAASGNITFAPGETSKTVVLEVGGDSAYEPEESFTLTATSSGTTVSSTGTILNDDAQPIATLSATAISIVEPAVGNLATVSLTVSLSNASYETVTVSYATADETAASGGNYNDYIAAAGTLSFAPGETSKTIEILVTGESFDEPNETFKVNLTAVQNASVGSPDTTTATIVDSDPTPVITVEGMSVDENGGPLGFVVTLSNPSSQPVTVNYTTVDGSGKAGVDYVATSGTLTFAPGETTLPVDIALLDDNLYEGLGESIQLQLSSPTNATIGSGDELTSGTVMDNDPKPIPTITSLSVNEDAGSATFTVTLSNPSGFAMDLSYSTLSGTATQGVDYTAVSGTLAFAAGETSKTVTAPILHDVIDEPNETFQLRIVNDGNVWQGTGTIEDNDAAPTLSVSSSAVAEGNSTGTPLTFTFSLSNPSSQPIIVNYATANGTATAGSDYTAASGSVTFAPGETSQAVVVQLSGDTTYEAQETFTLTATTSGTTVSGTGTILNDDALPTVQIAGGIITEGNTGSQSLTFLVTLSNPSYQTVTVPYATANGAAIAGSDYQSASGTLTFAPGETSKSITVAVVGDRVPEPTETFSVNLNTPGNATIATGQATGTIVDNEPRISISDASLVEGRKNQSLFLTFTVTLSAAYDQTVTVSYRTVDGTAKAGEDYVAKSGKLTFAPGETSKTITVQLKGDSKRESNELLYLDLYGLSSNAISTKNRGTGTILNDD